MGNCMKQLLLTLQLSLPFMVIDFIAPEVNAIYLHTPGSRVMPTISYSDPLSILAGQTHKCSY